MPIVRPRLLLGLLAALALAFTALPGAAEPSEEAKRLMVKRDSERYQVETEHSSIKAGAARIHVATPIEQVRKVVSDFKNYPKFITQFQKARVVGRVGAKTDVYLQVPILNGASKIWAVVRFEPIKSADGEEQLEGHMVKGNVRRLDARWRLRQLDADNTQLNLELLIVPRLPLPGSLVTKQAAYAADEAVVGSRDRAETAWKKKKTKG